MEKTTGAKRPPMASWERLGQRGRLLRTVRWVSFLPGIFFTFFHPLLFFLSLARSSRVGTQPSCQARAAVSMEVRRGQLMRAIRKAAKIGHSRMITRKRVMAVLDDEPGYRGWMHDDRWDNGHTAYECKKRGLIEMLGKGKWKVTRAGMKYKERADTD